MIILQGLTHYLHTKEMEEIIMTLEEEVPILMMQDHIHLIHKIEVHILHILKTGVHILHILKTGVHILHIYQVVQGNIHLEDPDKGDLIHLLNITTILPMMTITTDRGMRRTTETKIKTMTAKSIQNIVF